MNLSETVRSAFTSLGSNRLRSALASLGVLIGVTSVVSLVGLVTGLENYVNSQFDTVLGANVFEVTRWSGGFTSLEDWLESRSWPPLTSDEGELLAEMMTTAEAVSWRSSDISTVSWFGVTAENVRVRGFSPSEINVANLSVDFGRYFTWSEDRGRARVCVLGHELAENFQSPGRMVSRDVKIGGVRFRVIGVNKPLGSIFGIGLDNYIAIPFSTFGELYPERARSVAIGVMVGEGVSMEECQEEARAALRLIRGLRFGPDDNFHFTTQQGIIDSLEQITGAVAIVTIGIAAISLLVGGIGIMNIMLVSVTERTKEIGTRRALGARKIDITGQFVAEAIVISLLGGVAGLAVGTLLVAAADALTPIPAAVSPSSVLLALSFSTGTGLVFGIFPAWKAARMDPVEALRYE